MRRVAAVLAVPIIVGLPLVTTSAGSPAEQAAVKSVRVDVRCDAAGVGLVSVDPWQLQLDEGDEVEWVLAAGSQATSIAIEPKTPGAAAAARWPFNDAPPRRGGRGQPARAGNMKPNQASPNPYRYNIAIECQAAGGSVHHIVIDPDIVIR